jgi:acyl-coenzyme A thioesterase PaaI-like protein
MSIDFLRPAMGADLYASATILKEGRAGLVGRIHLWVGDDIETIVAIATGTYVAPIMTDRRVD